MPALPRYLTRSRSGVYKFQRGIPEDIRDAVGRGTTWRENLQTKDLNEARLRVHEVAGRVEREFQSVRGGIAALPPPSKQADIPAVHEIAAAVERWKQTELYRRANEISAKGPVSRIVAFDRESTITQAFGRPEKAEASDAFMTRLEDEERHVGGWIEEIARREGWSLPSEEGPIPNPLRQTLYMAVVTAWRSILEKERRWIDFDFADLPTSAPPINLPPRDTGQPVPNAIPHSLTLRDALASWSATPAARSARARQHRTARPRVPG